MVGVIARQYDENLKNSTKFEQSVKDACHNVLNQWARFEEYIKVQPQNRSYFRLYTDPATGQQILEVNFDNYYKGRTLSNDLVNFPW